MMYNVEIEVVDNFNVEADSMEEAFERAVDMAVAGYEAAPYQVNVRFAKEIK